MKGAPRNVGNETARDRRSGAQSPEESGNQTGYFNEWTEDQKEHWKSRNPLTIGFKYAKPSPAVTLPSQLGSVQLTQTTTSPMPTRLSSVILTPEPEVAMPGGFTQGKEGAKKKKEANTMPGAFAPNKATQEDKKNKRRIIETDSD